MSIILWIDPGTTLVGFALLEKKWSDFSILDYGVFSTTPNTELGVKLWEIGSDFVSILQKYQPDLVSIEKLFFNTNITTGISVSHARWVIIYETIKQNIPYVEYTPLQVKKAITGKGSANKAQLQNAIKMIFRLDDIPKPDDAADAIWLAYMWWLNMNAMQNNITK